MRQLRRPLLGAVCAHVVTELIEAEIDAIGAGNSISNGAIDRRGPVVLVPSTTEARKPSRMYFQATRSVNEIRYGRPDAR